METAVRAERTGHRPDQLYLCVWGALLVVLGVGSLLVHPDFGVGADVSGEHLFGVVETNGWHGVAGLTLGLLSLAYARSDRWAPAAAAVVGGVGGVIPALILFAAGDGHVALGLVPVDIADAVSLHLVPGVLGLVCGALGARR